MDQLAEPTIPSSSVLDLLRERRASRSMPGQRDHGDAARVALLVEGGGMRGVVTAAMLTAIEDLGFKGAFDGVYGCSAGAMNAAYFLSASETWYYLSIYFDHLAHRDFVDFRRAVRRRDILSLEYAFDEVVAKRMPLNLGAVRASVPALTVLLSSVETATPLRVSLFSSDQELMDALVATCWLPIARRGTATFRGRPTLDGGLLTPDLVEPAREDGFTHVLYLRSRPSAQGERDIPITRRLMARHFDRLSPGLGAAYLLSRSTPAGAGHSPASILQIRPVASEHELVRHEIRPARLLEAARAAYERAIDVLDPSDRARSVVPRFVVRSQAEREARPAAFVPGQTAASKD